MNVAFIPVRGGSKSIPLKNIKEINGKPLVYWTVRAACECNFIDRVYIATDSAIIREVVIDFIGREEKLKKAEVISRSEESASDTASTESAMIEFAEKYEFDNIALIQATSPLLTGADLDRGFEIFKSDGTDSVISAVAQKRFNWKIDKKGNAVPLNYDVYNRPRRQDFEGYYVENGAFYIVKKSDLLKTKNRVFGNIKICEMCEESFFEIDEESDWKIVESIMKKRNTNNKFDFSGIKLFLTDCDGCLTDGGMYYSENGDELKKFNTRDGMGFSLLKNKGIKVGIVTSESVKLNRRRAEKLRLDLIIDGCKDKLAAVKEICQRDNIKLDEVLYIGDDINDLELMKAIGYSCCPKDAAEVVIKTADYVSKFDGGQGVIREIADMLISTVTSVL